MFKVKYIQEICLEKTNLSMANYNYKEGKQRVLRILNNAVEVQKSKKVPKPDSSFSFNNGFNSWVTAVFVDIRDSKSLFSQNKKTTVARVIRAFTSEIIEILKDDNNLREIGIRGDCVYAIYTCSTENEDYEILDKAIYVNTYIDMLNVLLSNKQMPNIKAGIGIATAMDLVVKAGRKGSDINNLVWIGDAVSFAAGLSSEANKHGKDKILMTKQFYNGVIKQLKNNHPKKNIDNWFSFYKIPVIGECCGCNLVKTNFDNWIKNGMK